MKEHQPLGSASPSLRITMTDKLCIYVLHILAGEWLCNSELCLGFPSPNSGPATGLQLTKTWIQQKSRKKSLGLIRYRQSSCPRCHRLHRNLSQGQIRVHYFCSYKGGRVTVNLKKYGLLASLLGTCFFEKEIKP